MKYSIIYADPPWAYEVWSKKGEGRSAESHYKTQKIDSLMDMSVQELADTNCALFMWATFPCLKDAIKLGEAWGFTYKTVAFTWVKKNRNANTPFVGMGYYTRANAEIVLLFTKGKSLIRENKDVQQILFEDEVVYSEIGRHSQKPDEIRKRIVRLFGDVPRLELFARSRDGLFSDYEYEGWDVFGNECNGSIDLNNFKDA